MNNQQLIQYQFFTKKDFENLATRYGTNCISIYIPTQRAGKEVDEGLGQLKLKNAIKELNAILQHKKLSPVAIKNYLRPLELLLEDIHFWRNQSDGLAIFLDNSGMEFYTLPLDFEYYVYVNNHFYLKPLIPFFNGDGMFYLLQLTQHDARLYVGTRHSIAEILIQDLIPDKAEDLKDNTNLQKNLQYKTIQPEADNVCFFGHGGEKDHKKEDIKAFFRAVDSGIIAATGNDKYPLILACLDQHYATYKSISKYPKLFHKYISGNPLSNDLLLLHEKAWELVKDYFQLHKKSKVMECRSLLGTSKASTEMEKIIPAAVDGRVETLFVQASKEAYGLYDKVNRTVILDDKKTIENASLPNLTTVKSFLQGAKVYFVYPNEMPIKGTLMNALFRY